jgi:hypothetical protein
MLDKGGERLAGLGLGETGPGGDGGFEVFEAHVQYP